jgi:hypothetical protein
MLDWPGHVPLRIRGRTPLRYAWDDTRASSDFMHDGDWVVQAAARCSLRARMVLCLGLYERIVGRFDGLHDDPLPWLIAQAGWCGAIDPRCLRYFELDRRQWLGAVRGPLWCAATWLRPALADGDRFPAEVDDGLQYLTRLALHVDPEPEALTEWLAAVLARFASAHPAMPQDPFDDLFDRAPGRRRGPLVGRAELDLDSSAGPQDARHFVADLLADVAREPNPFVATPREMAQAGLAALPW